MKPFFFLSAMNGPENGKTFWMPEQASTVAPNNDALFNFILYLSIFFFVLIVAAMVIFVFKYKRRNPDQKTSPISGNHKLELIWSVIPTILLAVIFLWGFKDWMHLNVPPSEALDIRVLGRKWNWEFDYPREGITGVPEIVVPVNRAVKLTMMSQDVLHSFYVPAFRVKRDLLPNRYSVLWFEPTMEGTFDILCTEYCGNAHSRMLSKVRVVSESEFKKWLETGGDDDPNANPIEKGKKLFASKGCTTCHSLTKERGGLAGPPLAGKYGTKETLSDGSQTTIDDNYIRQSVMEPQSQVVQGYAPVMPTFKGRLADKQINALIDYIKSLK